MSLRYSSRDIETYHHPERPCSEPNLDYGSQYEQEDVRPYRSRTVIVSTGNLFQPRSIRTCRGRDSPASWGRTPGTGLQRAQRTEPEGTPPRMGHEHTYATLPGAKPHTR